MKKEKIEKIFDRNKNFASATNNIRLIDTLNNSFISGHYAEIFKEQDSVFLPADFDYYSEVSSKAMGIIEKYADVFEYVGRDEAYLDVTKKTESDFHNAEHLAQQLKNEIRNNLKLTCSVGITPNKLLSKIASDYKKPDGITIVKPEQVLQTN